MAPQQPAAFGRSVSMPSASSTRAVAVLMFGAIAGCTQPSSSSTFFSCVRAGHAPGRVRSGTLAFSEPGSSGRTSWPTAIAGANATLVRPSFSAVRIRRSPAGRTTWSSTILRPMSTRRPYCTPDGQVVSQLRHVRQRSRCTCVERVTSLPSSTCFIR